MAAVEGSEAAIFRSWANVAGCEDAGDERREQKKDGSKVERCIKGPYIIIPQFPTASGKEFGILYFVHRA
jgi:hypothetical protein